jgi:hypothetical protein
MVGGAATLISGWTASGIAIAVIAVGVALVMIELGDVRRQHAKHNPGTYPLRIDRSGDMSSNY